MKSCRNYFLPFLIAVAQPAAAEQTRMDWIAKSSLIRDLKRDGDWEVQFGANRADYRCVTCKGQIEASIEVIAPYTAGDFPTLS